MKAEEQLKQIAAEGAWDIPALAELRAGAESLVDVMTTMIQTEWQGATSDAASIAFTTLRSNFVAVAHAAGSLHDLLRGANMSREKAIAEIDGLSSATVDPAIVTAARTASAVVFRGFTFPADGAVSLIENMLGNEREEQAQAALDKLHTSLGNYGEAMMETIVATRDIAPGMPGFEPPVIPDPPPSSYPEPRGPSGTTPSAYPTSPMLTTPPVATGVGIYQPPVTIEPPVIDEHYRPPTGPSVDAPVVGTFPGGSGTVPSLPGGGTFPGGSSDFGNGGAGGSGSGGLGGNGSGSGGMGAGLIGGGAGAAAAAAAAAAKARLTAGGAGGAGGVGRLGAGGLGGAHGVSGAGSAAGGAGGRLGAGGLGAGGLGGAGGVGSGAGGAAGGTGTAGGAGRLGGGGLLGSQGGGAAGGGNTTVATTTNAGGAGGRGAGGMMGGAGSDDDRERRGGLGGLMAPKLDDESDAAPRSAGASAGGRDQQPTD